MTVAVAPLGYEKSGDSGLMTVVDEDEDDDDDDKDEACISGPDIAVRDVKGGLRKNGNAKFACG